MEQLPCDLLSHMISWLSVRDVLRLGTTSGHMNGKLRGTHYQTTKYIRFRNDKFELLWNLMVRFPCWKSPEVLIRIFPSISKKCLGMMPFESCIVNIVNSMQWGPVVTAGNIKNIEQHYKHKYEQKSRLKSLSLDGAYFVGLEPVIELPPLMQLERLKIRGPLKITSPVNRVRYPFLKRVELEVRSNGLQLLESISDLSWLSYEAKLVSESDQKTLFRLAPTIKHLELICKKKALSMGDESRWPMLETLKVDQRVVVPVGLKLERIELYAYPYEIVDYLSQPVKDLLMDDKAQHIIFPLLTRNRQGFTHLYFNNDNDEDDDDNKKYKRKKENKEKDQCWLRWIECMKDKTVTFHHLNAYLAIMTLNAFPSMKVFIGNKRLFIDVKERTVQHQDKIFLVPSEKRQVARDFNLTICVAPR